ncbi:MAG TPA: acyltransferase family protein [Planctomycetota bacterium]|nr:acyltransferase family protein [Planctomycetota bacterium]
MRGPPRTSNTQTPHGPPATAGDSGDGRRYHALDNLRAWMMLLLIPFHAALPFLTVPALMRFNDPDAGVAFDATALFLLSFRRPVFFVMGGFFAAMLLERRGVRGMLANRAQRILAPLVLGWIVLSPATHAAYDFALGAANGGSTRAGMAKLGEGDWIDWERPFHLWFLAALLIFYAAALGLRWALPRILGRHLWAYEEGTRRFFASRWRALLLAAALAPLLVPSEFLPYNRGNPFLALSLALMFGLGGRLYVHRDLLGELRRGAWTHVVLGFALLPLATWTRWNVVHDSPHELAWGLVSGLSGTLMSALLVFGTIGVFLRHADGHSRALRYLSDSSYWVYLAHMPVVVVLGGLFATTELPAVLKFTLTVAGTTVFTLATYSLFVRHTAIGRLLNGPRRRGGSVAGKSI